MDTKSLANLMENYKFDEEEDKYEEMRKKQNHRITMDCHAITKMLNQQD